MSSASQPVLPVGPPTEHWTELSIVDRILRAADWPELKRWAEVALGPSSFELGVCCGIVENIAGSVIGVLDLLKTFILAGLYARARQGLPWWDVLGLPEYLAAKGAELVLGAELKKAHDTCEALMRQVMYVVKHPREFLKTTKDNYLRQYTQKWELFQRLSVQTDLTSQFRAGEIFGEVLLDVLMLVMIAAGAAEAAAKLAGEVPELVKLAENLKGVLKVKPGALRVGGAAASEVEAAELPTVTREPVTTYLDDQTFKYYMKAVEQLDVSTAPHEAVFYSGVGNRQLAEAFAEANGKKTLEMTPGGRWLEEQKLFGKDSPLYGDQALQVWAKLSKRFAQQASGGAVGFVDGASSNGIFNTVESPALEYNKAVTVLITGGH